MGKCEVKHTENNSKASLLWKAMQKKREMWRWIRMLSITSGTNIIKNEEFGVIRFLSWASIPLVFPIITVAIERSILTLSRWLFTRSESSFCQWNLMINSIIWDYLSLTNSFANAHFCWFPPHILHLSRRNMSRRVPLV